MWRWFRLFLRRLWSWTLTGVGDLIQGTMGDSLRLAVVCDETKQKVAAMNLKLIALAGSLMPFLLTGA